MQEKLLTGEMMSAKCRHNMSVITLRHVADSFVSCQMRIISPLFEDVQCGAHMLAPNVHVVGPEHANSQ